MRILKLMIAVCFVSSLSLAQVNIAGGTAGNWGPSYGIVVVPYVPLITTPSVSLSTFAPSPGGASSTAFGTVAGATNSTLSIPVTSSSGTYSTPEWYGASTSPEVGEAPREHHAERGRKELAYELGLSEWEGNRGAASLVASAGQSRKASRTYVNQDVERMNDSNGTVKVRGEKRHI